MPGIGESGFTTPYGDRKRKRASQQPGSDVTAPGTDPIAVVQQESRGTIPTDVHVSLAKLGYDNRALARAARIAAKTYDMTPQQVLGKSTVADIKDGITSGNLRLDSLRLATDGAAPAVIYQQTLGWIEAYNASTHALMGDTRGPRASAIEANTVGTKRVARLLEVIGRYSKGQGLDAKTGIYMALSLAQARVNPKNLEDNLRFIDQWSHGVTADWNTRVGIALKSARDHVRFASLADVSDYVNRGAFNVAGVASEREKLYALGWNDTTIAEAIKYDMANKDYEATHNGAQLPIPAGLPGDPHAVASIGSNLKVREALVQYEGSLPDYVKEAEALQNDLRLQQEAFQNSWLNKHVITPVMKFLSLDNRVFEMIGIGAQYGASASQVGPLGETLRAAQTIQEAKSGQAPVSAFAQQNWLQNLYEDEKAAWAGELRLSDTLVRDYGMNRWVAEGTEFAAGWFLDPLIVAGKGLKRFTMRDVNPLILAKKGKAVADARLTAYANRVDGFATKAGKDLAPIFASGTDEDIVMWNRAFRKPVMGQPFDVPWLMQMKDRAAEMGLEGKALEQQIGDAMRLHLAGGVPGDIIPGSLADSTYLSRLELSKVAREEARTQPFWQTTEYQGKVMTYIDKARVTERDAFGFAAIDKTDYLPRYPEIPQIAKPIPGMGYVQAVGNVYGRDIGDTAVGRQFRKLPTVSVGGDLQVHEDPMRWVRLNSRRAGFAESDVVSWETKFARAVASPNPENGLKSLVDDFEMTVAKTYGATLGITDTEQLRGLLDTLATRGGFKRGADRAARSFGERNYIQYSADGIPYVSSNTTYGSLSKELPLGSSQAVNEIASIDPILIKQFLDDYVGVTRRFIDVSKRMLGKDLDEFVRTTGLGHDFFTVGGVTRRFGKVIGKDIVQLFKFQAVARPAYIFRVVLGDELARSFATTQSMWEQMVSYGWGRGFVDRVPDPGIVRRVLAKPATLLEDKQVGFTDILDREGNVAYTLKPGYARGYEALAATYQDYADLTAESMKQVLRREKALQMTGEWTELTAASSTHVDWWEHKLNLQIRHSNGLRHAAELIGDGSVRSPEELEKALKEWVSTKVGKDEMRRIGWRGDSWAGRAANDVWGTTMGNPELARLAVAGEVDKAYLESHFARDLWRKGEQVVTKAPKGEDGKVLDGWVHQYGRPNINGAQTTALTGDSRYRRFVNAWYKVMVGAPENTLNRIPYYNTWKGRAENMLARSVDPATLRNPEVIKKIDDISREFSLRHNTHIMFDFTENNRVGELMSFVFPFMQPWQENIMVWGHIFTRENPAMVGYVNRLAQAGVNSGFIRKDEATGEWVIPETWWAFASPVMWMIGGRSKGQLFDSDHNYSLSTGLTSLNLFASSTFPVDGIPLPAPGMSPYANYVLTKFLSHKDLPSGIEQYLFQYGSTQNIGELAKESFVPRWLRTATANVPVLGDLIGDKDLLNKLTINYMELQQYQGLEPDMAQAHLQAAMTLPYLAIMAATAPGAVHVSFPFTWMETLWKQKLDEFGQDWMKTKEWWSENYPKMDMITIPKTTAGMVQNFVDANGQAHYKDVTGVNPPIKGIRPLSTAFAEEILKQPGFKEFASNPETAMWASVFMLNAGNPDMNQFDLSAYAAQLQRGDIRAQTYQEVYASHQEYLFNLAWGKQETQYDAEFAKLTRQGFDDNDQVWKELSDEKAATLERIGAKFSMLDAEFLQPREGGGYQFSFSTENQFPEGVHPAILHSAVAVMNSPIAKDFPAVKGLSAYWDLRQQTKDELANAGFRGLESDGAEGLKAKYDAQVQNIIANYPEFETFYTNWFRNDLGYGLPTAGEKQIAEWKAQGQGPGTTYGAYTTFDSAMDNFTTRANKSRVDKLDVNTSDIYQQRTAFVNETMKTHPEFVQTWWDKQSAGEKAQAMRSLATRPTVFYSRFDWKLMGVNVTQRAAGWLQTMQEKELHISQVQERTDGYASSGPMHEDVARFVQSKLKLGDKSFAKAVDSMNTLGFGAVALGYVVDNPHGKPQKAWAALYEAINADRRIAEKNHIHGDDKRVEFDPDNRAWWTNERQGISKYIQILEKWDTSGVFKEQLAGLASAYGDNLIDYFIPPIYFKTGEVNAYG